MIRRMNTGVLLIVALLAQTAAHKVDIVSVSGCLREVAPDNWMLVNATDPVPSSANAPEKKDMPAAAPVGRNQFKLIGVSEFNLPQYKDHAVIVKGLHIKAQPISRLNVTSVTTISASCPAAR
jgi:hypothetical protein